mmetsp:Transcript_1198/g.1961  ORF Transcript_1198/g.1961 Transcript_1198/m.1961 type:complete len:82 (+) Transcript_1198:209-454(+)
MVVKKKTPRTTSAHHEFCDHEYDDDDDDELVRTKNYVIDLCKELTCDTPFVTASFINQSLFTGDIPFVKRVLALMDDTFAN